MKRKNKRKTATAKAGASSYLLGINGLHLWKIATNRTSTGEHLWITTRQKNTKQAVDKAVSFVRKTVGQKDEVTVEFIKYCGTLDA
jgi:hypothetical protein